MSSNVSNDISNNTSPQIVVATMHHASSSSSMPALSISSATTNNNYTNSSAIIPLPLRMVLSAVAGMGAATVCHPLDVIRVQMQTFHFNSTTDAARSIYRSSGIKNGLYAGISAAYLRQWLYGSCRMGIYSYLLELQKTANIGKSDQSISFGTKLGMGCISGAIGSFVGTPSEVALVRMSADSKLPLAERRNYTSVFNCLQRIAKEEGPTQLWRGATPTVVRATLLSSASLGVTSQAKLVLNESGYFGPNGDMMSGLPVMFIATLVSSFCANVVANPFDVIKSRMQQMPIPPSGQAPLYTSMVDCFVKSIRAEGLMVVYKGFTPAFVKLAPYSIISLTLADKLTKAVTGKDAL
jgi:solute carrier family 25 oxoglutarate transporter 11